MKIDRDVWFREGKDSTLKDVKDSIIANSNDNKRFRSRYLSITSDGDPINIFKSWIPNNYKIDIRSKKDFHLIDIKREIPREDLPNGRRFISGTVGIFKNKSPNTWTLFTNDSRDFFDLVLRRFVDFHYPELSPIYLSSTDLQTVFSRLSKLSYTFYSKKAITKTSTGTKMEYSRPYPVEYIFEKSYDDGHYVNLIEFMMKKDNENVLHASISRNGVSTFYSGDIEFFYMNYLNSISEIGKSKVKLFSNKHQKLGERVVHPLNLVYEKDMFISSKDNSKFISVLSQLEHSSIAVIHNNPYVHLNVLDYLDGSSFDIFVDSANSISFIPRFRASSSSISRITQRIFEGFGEGEITEEGEEDNSLNSVLVSK